MNYSGSESADGEAVSGDAAEGSARESDSRVGGATVAPDTDAIDHIYHRWAQLRPELDLAPIPLIGRILRAGALIVRTSDDALARHGLSRGEFDILSALRRGGAPQSPGTLRTVGLASAPATTKRLHALERRNLIVRSANPADGRGALIALTAAGIDLIDGVFPEVLTVEAELLSGIPYAERASTAAALRTLLASVEARARPQ